MKKQTTLSLYFLVVFSFLQAETVQERYTQLKQQAQIAAQKAAEFARTHKKELITGAVVATGIGVAAVGAAKAAPSQDVCSATNNRPKFRAQTSQVRSVLENNIVTAVNRSDTNYLRKTFSEVCYPRTLLNSLLFLAIPGGEPEVVQILIDQGASARAVDGKGNSTLYWAARRSLNPGAEYERAKEIINMLIASVHLSICVAREG